MDEDKNIVSLAVLVVTTRWRDPKAGSWAQRLPGLMDMCIDSHAISGQTLMGKRWKCKATVIY